LLFCTATLPAELTPCVSFSFSASWTPAFTACDTRRHHG
jgi:hypothetical protein